MLVPGREDPLWRKYTWCCSCSRCGRSYLCVLYGKGIGGAVKLVLVGKAALRATRSLWDGGSGCWSSFLPISHCASSDAQWNRTHSVSPPRTATSGRSRAKRVERIASCDAFLRSSSSSKDDFWSLLPGCRGRHRIAVCVSTDNLRNPLLHCAKGSAER